MYETLFASIFNFLINSITVMKDIVFIMNKYTLKYSGEKFIIS